MKAVAFGSSDHLSRPTPGCDITICGSFWKSAATTTIPQVLVDRVEGEQQVAAHVEIELAGGEHEAIVGLRPARHNGHVETVFGVCSIDQGLIIAAVLGLGEPVGAEGDLVGGVCGRRIG